MGIKNNYKNGGKKMKKLILSSLKSTGSFEELAAQAKPGDIIIVHSGEYDRCETMGKTIVVQQDSMGSSVDLESIFYINGETIVPSGRLSFENHFFHDNWTVHRRGFLVCYDRDGLVLVTTNGILHIVDSSDCEEYKATPDGVIVRKGDHFIWYRVADGQPYKTSYLELACKHWMIVKNSLVTISDQGLAVDGIIVDSEWKILRTPDAMVDGSGLVVWDHPADEPSELHFVAIPEGTSKILPPNVMPTCPCYSIHDGGVYRDGHCLYDGPFNEILPNDYGLVILADDFVLQLIDPR